jgi:tetratricopeptide (TPR) repeat protein
MMVTIFATPEPAAVLAGAEAAAVKALALAPQNAGAHFVLGVIYLNTKRPTLAVEECRETIALDRNHAQAHAHIGAAQILLGRAEETEQHIARALRLSPRDPLAYLWYSLAGIANCALGRYKEGADWLHRSIVANRSYPIAHFVLAAALAQQGRSDEARAEITSGLLLIPDFSIRRCREGASSDNPTYLAYFEHFIAGLRKAGLPEE